MEIVITGSLGNIGRELTSSLVEKGHELTVISRSRERTQEIEALGAKTAIGQVTDYGFLKDAFQGAAAVFTMIPPYYEASGVTAFMTAVSENYAKAIEHAGVKYVVNLSSVGAPLSGGDGPLKDFYNPEQSLDRLKDVNVLHLRPGMFYTNFFGSMELIKYQQVIGNNFDATIRLMLSHPKDIADKASEALNTLSFKGKNAVHLASDELTGQEIAGILGNAINMPDLSWINLSDEALLAGMLQSGLPKDLAENYYVAMGVAIREGLLTNHYQQYPPDATGRISFRDFAAEFAAVYKQTMG